MQDDCANSCSYLGSKAGRHDIAPVRRSSILCSKVLPTNVSTAACDGTGSSVRLVLGILWDGTTYTSPSLSSNLLIVLLLGRRYCYHPCVRLAGCSWTEEHCIGWHSLGAILPPHLSSAMAEPCPTTDCHGDCRWYGRNLTFWLWRRRPDWCCTQRYFRNNFHPCWASFFMDEHWNFSWCCCSPKGSWRKYGPGGSTVGKGCSWG